MDSKAISNGILRALGIVVGTCFLLYFLYEIRSVLLYILIGAAVSLMGRPLILFMTNKLKMRDGIAVIITLVLFLLIFVGIFTLFVPLILQQVYAVAQINMSELGAELTRLTKEFTDHFHLEDVNFIEILQSGDIGKYLSISWIPDLLNSVFGSLGGFLIGLFSVVFIAFFALKDSKLLENSLLVFAKNEDESKFMNAFTKIKELLSRYFLGLLIQVTVLFVLYSILFLILKIENPFALALVAGLLNLIPYVGPVISLVIMVGLTVTSNIGMDFSSIILPKLTWILIGHLAIQMIDNFVNQPIIFGNSVRSHPLEIFLSISIMGILFGVPGLIAAVPFYTAIKVISKEFLSEYKIVKSLTKEI